MSGVATNDLVSQAVALQKQGRINDAAALYRQVLQLDPEHAAAIHFLGLAAHQQGQDEEAETLMQRAVELEPYNPVFLGNFAQLLVARDKLQLAIPTYQRWIELDPSNAPAWCQLGTVFSKLQGSEAAAECWRRALIAQPGYTPALVALADNLHACQLRQEAEVAYRKATQQTPHDIELYCKLAALLTEMQRTDEALQILELATELDRGSPAVHCQRGITLSTCGDLDAAEASLRRSIALAPDFYEAYVHLVTLRKLTLQDPAYIRLDQAAKMQENQQDPGRTVNVQFSLGRILQDNGLYDSAFSCFTACKTARRKLIPYSHEGQAANFNALRQLFNADYIARMQCSENSSDVPIFIIGMPRSGTTLLEQCLARHPEIRAGGEMVLLHAALRRRLNERYRADLAGGLRDLGASGYSELARDLTSDLEVQAGESRFITDKMPSNFALAGLLHTLFPRARILHCKRDALDTCTSCYTTLFRSGHGFADDLLDLGRYYRLYLEMMEHWRHVLPDDRLYELDYEALVARPEAELRRLLEFLNLPWHPECLNFGKTTGPIHTASVIQVRRPLYQSSIGRWRQYQIHLSKLREALGKTAELPDAL
jgi:tetratricopeptide (TPR) repeat protein